MNGWLIVIFASFVILACLLLDPHSSSCRREVIIQPVETPVWETR